MSSKDSNFCCVYNAAYFFYLPTSEVGIMVNLDLGGRKVKKSQKNVDKKK